jgi:hypothetical protein
LITDQKRTLTFIHIVYQKFFRGEKASESFSAIDFCFETIKFGEHHFLNTNFLITLFFKLVQKKFCLFLRFWWKIGEIVVADEKN